MFLFVTSSQTHAHVFRGLVRRQRRRGVAHYLILGNRSREHYCHTYSHIYIYTCVRITYVYKRKYYNGRAKTNMRGSSFSTPRPRDDTGSTVINISRTLRTCKSGCLVVERAGTRQGLFYYYFFVHTIRVCVCVFRLTDVCTCITHAPTDGRDGRRNRIVDV